MGLTVLSRINRLPATWLVGLFALLSLVPLVLLAYFSITLATDAVRREVEARIRTTSSVSAAYVQREMGGLAELVESYAGRPHLFEALGGGDPKRRDRELVRFHLSELRQSREGIHVVFVADPDGRLIDILPSTPAIVGRDFSSRDWYRGVTTTGRTYVSEAYESAAAGAPRVVAAAAPVRSARPGDGGRVVAILVAGYEIDTIQSFAVNVSGAEGVGLTVTDQRGVVVAAPDRAPSGLISKAADPLVAAALAGVSGTVEANRGERRMLSAYSPSAGSGGPWSPKYLPSLPSPPSLASAQPSLALWPFSRWRS